MKLLYAGYAREDITPDSAVCISGYGDDEIRRSQGARDRLYLTCIAVRQAEDTVLLFDADLLAFNDWLAEEFHRVVCPATGVPAEHIFCGATHTHSGPSTYIDQEDSVRFRGLLLEAAVKAAQAALADLAPATLLSATKTVEGMNFVRHYLMNDGSYSGSNFGDHSLTCVAHADEADPRLLLVKFAREGKPDIVLMNWQAHADNCRQVGYYLLSSSYPGHVRAKFEQETGMHFAFFMGASGNLNPFSRIPAEDHGLDYIAYGEKMAQYAIEALEQLKPVAGSGIAAKRVVFHAPVDHSWDHMLPQANAVFDTWKTVGRLEAYEQGRTYGFSSQYQANAIRLRVEMPATTDIVLSAFRIGELAFVAGPNEIFCGVGLHVRLHAPYENCFIISGNHKYLPSMVSYEYRSYEADTSLYAKGTAEQVAATFVELLRELR